MIKKSHDKADSMHNFTAPQNNILSALKKEILNLINNVTEHTTSDAVYEMNLILMNIINNLTTQDEIKSIFDFCKKYPPIMDLIGKIIKENKFPEMYPLQIAITQNNTYVIYKLLNLGMVKNQRQHCETDAIFHLISKGHTCAVMKFLDSGAEPNQREASWGIPLAGLMLQFKKTYLFNLFLNRYHSQINFHILSSEKRTLLYYAVLSGNPENVDLLLSHGVNPKQSDIYGYMPLDYALFYGNLRIAQKLSTEPVQVLQRDPRYKNPPPKINHHKIGHNVVHFLKIKYIQTQDQSTTFKVSNINDGICNGWAMLAALCASESDEALQRHYVASALIGNWDKQPKSLSQRPDSLEEDLTLDDLFLQFNNDVYWFYQQSDAFSGISKNDRRKQVELISDRRRVEPLADFGLPDLQQDELQFILNAYRPLANDTIIDERSNGHDCTYYQKTADHIQYFDINYRYRLPTFQSYDEVLEQTNEVHHATINLGYFHAHPERMDETLKTSFSQTTDMLIQRFIIDNPSRMEKIDKIISHAAIYGLPILLQHLLTHHALQDKISKTLIKKNISLACHSETFECVYVLYKHASIDLDDLSASKLEHLLRTAIQYDDKKMYRHVRETLMQNLSSSAIVPSTEQHSLLSFKFPKPIPDQKAMNKNVIEEKNRPKMP